MQRNARIGSESILALCCVATSVNAKAMQHNIWYIVNRPYGSSQTAIYEESIDSLTYYVKTTFSQSFSVGLLIK